MDLDRRGDIGFMEAMAGAMTVCIALLAFTSYIAADAVVSADELSFDEDVLECITITDGRIFIDSDEVPIGYMETHGLTGFSITVSSVISGYDQFMITWGNIGEEHGTWKYVISRSTDEGQVVPLIVEVAFCR